jgi:hypothetical protein
VEESERLPYWAAVLLNSLIAFGIGVVLLEMQLWAALEMRRSSPFWPSRFLWRGIKTTISAISPRLFLLFNTFVALISLYCWWSSSTGPADTFLRPEDEY